jgi:hypothetical protein
VRKRPHHEQHISSHVLGVLKAKLAEPEKRRLDKILQDLNQRNRYMTQVQHDGFLYGGAHELPRYRSNNLPLKGQLKGLSPELFDEMEALIADRHQSELNLSFSTQVIFAIIKNCETLEDIRNALPDHLWILYGHPQHIDRTREELWTIRDNPTLLRQYQQFEQIMAIFMVGRMMY